MGKQGSRLWPGKSTEPLPASDIVRRQPEALPAGVAKVLAGTGSALTPALRQDMEQHFGHDFSQVLVHSDDAARESARALSARWLSIAVGD